MVVTSLKVQRIQPVLRESCLTRSERKDLEALRHQAKKLTQQTVRILNPIIDGITRLRVPSAAKYVNAGRAQWVILSGGERCIEFTDTRLDNIRVKAAADREADRAVHSTVATLAQVARLPMVRPGDVVAPSPRRHFGTVKSVWRNKQGRTSDERAYCDGREKLAQG